MTNFNTDSDSANTAVRAFLTKVGAFYNGGKAFNTSSGSGKKIWLQIMEDFDNSCCYCGEKGKMSMEHLIMFNRKEFGLHHPGNVVPCCAKCNKRLKNDEKEYLSWELHLKKVAGSNFDKRLKKILTHIKKYSYPELSELELRNLKIIAQTLYEHIKQESNKSYEMYLRLRDSRQ